MVCSRPVSMLILTKCAADQSIVHQSMMHAVIKIMKIC